ncbi:MAG: hypothetical protein RIA69_08440 [Cyclobacteriaceae bacterium]
MSLPIPRIGIISLASGGKGYVFSGRNTESQSLFKFDPITEEWINITVTHGLGNFDYGRGWSVGFAIGDCIYVGGGQGSKEINGGRIYSDFIRYDPVNNIFEEAASIPERTTRSLSFSVNGKGYIGSGFNDRFYEYDPSTNKWKIIPNPQMVSIRTYSNVGFSYKEKGYALIGKRLWELDPTTYTWTEKAAFPGDERGDLFSFVLDDHAFVGHGYVSWNQEYKDIYRYNFMTDTWMEMESIIDAPAGSASSFVIDKTAYLFANRTVYEYTIE